MTDRLDQASFDRFIKDHFENFKVSYDAGTWSALEQKLEAQGLAREEDPAIDKIAKNALIGLAVPLDSSWSAMEEKLEAEQLTTEDYLTVDKLAKHALSDFTVPYVASTWEALSDRLERMDYNQKLLALKVVEMAVFILTILTCIRILNVVPKPPEPPISQREFAFESPLEAPSPEPTLHAREMHSNTRKKQTESGKIDHSISASGPVNADVMSTTSNQHGDAVGTKTFASGSTRSETSSNDIVIPISGHPRSGLASVKSLKSSAEERLSDYLPISSLENKEPPKVEEIAFQSTPVEPLGYQYAQVPVIVSGKGKQKILTKVGVFTQLNAHRIKSLNPVNLGHQEQVTNAIGFGMVSNVQFGKLGFDLGLAYEKLNYPHHLDNHIIHKAQIPLHLKWVPIRNKFLNIYLKAGATFNGALYARYNDLTPYLGAAPGSPSYQDDGPKYNDGLLKGGTLEDNFYVSSSFGGGFESMVYRQISFFAEGLYQNYMSRDGISIVSDNRFNTISINFGLYYILR